MEAGAGLQVTAGRDSSNGVPDFRTLIEQGQPAVSAGGQKAGLEGCFAPAASDYLFIFRQRLARWLRDLSPFFCPPPFPCKPSV
jgi:hypothetical protein